MLLPARPNASAAAGARAAALGAARVVALAAALVTAPALAGCARDATTAPEGPGAPPAAVGPPRTAPPDLAELGSRIFDDRGLSLNRNQACASCHDAAYGFTAPLPGVNAGGAVMEGSIAGVFGKRKPPSAAYATFAPVLHRDPGSGDWVGGAFWDGRATGARLGIAAAEQAQEPLLAHTEQALPDAACVVYRVTHSTYASIYEAEWGRDAFDIAFPADIDRLCQQPGATVPLSGRDREQVAREFDHVALSIAAYEASAIVSPFSSKFDAWKRGLATLTPEEARGLALFEGKARCAVCHPSGGDRPLFTDFGYDNNGVPANPANPALLADPTYRDPGLGGITHAPDDLGRHKVPTLRNVDRRPSPGAVKAYMHNGVFKSLEEVVHFYNTRDVLPRCGAAAPADGGTGAALARGLPPGSGDAGNGARVGIDCWPAPEVPENVNRTDIGNLGLTPEEEAAIVAFLKTLSDGYSAPRQP
ncbi:MAG: cytochrome C [Gemmatimonadetes bacterium]|nr:cytochrome C [Gemmatimonadota bacterium]